MIDKSKARPAWSPDNLESVNRVEMTKNLFSEHSPFTSSAPSLELPSRLTDVQELKPYKYALPTEREIGLEVRGAEPSTSAGTGLKLDELVSLFVNRRPGKHGVREKVLDVVQRRCDIVDNADKNYQWLKWKH